MLREVRVNSDGSTIRQNGSAVVFKNAIARISILLHYDRRRDNSRTIIPYFHVNWVVVIVIVGKLLIPCCE